MMWWVVWWKWCCGVCLCVHRWCPCWVPCWCWCSRREPRWVASSLSPWLCCLPSSLEVLFAPERMAILSGSSFRPKEPFGADRSDDVELPFYNIMLKVPPWGHFLVDVSFRLSSPLFRRAALTYCPLSVVRRKGRLGPVLIHLSATRVYANFDFICHTNSRLGRRDSIVRANNSGHIITPAYLSAFLPD